MYKLQFEERVNSGNSLENMYILNNYYIVRNKRCSSL